MCGAQLKLFLMRAELKGAVEDADPVAGYACRACGAAYTSMDAVRLVDHSGDFLCEECGCCLSHGGQLCRWWAVVLKIGQKANGSR